MQTSLPLADLERISDERDCRFVDLYVRKSNQQAVSFYTKLGYYVHEEIPDYYQSFTNPSDTENAYDMHKLLHGWTKLKELVDKGVPKEMPSSKSKNKDGSGGGEGGCESQACCTGVVEDQNEIVDVAAPNSPKTKKKKKKNRKKKANKDVEPGGAEVVAE